MNPSTLLDDVQPEHLFAKPYPYVFKEKALPAAYCNDLVAQLPSLEWLAGGLVSQNNARFSFNARSVLEDQRMPPIWREFITQHLFQDYFWRLIDLFQLNRPDFRGGPLG